MSICLFSLLFPYSFFFHQRTRHLTASSSCSYTCCCYSSLPLFFYAPPFGCRNRESSLSLTHTCPHLFPIHVSRKLEDEHHTRLRISFFKALRDEEQKMRQSRGRGEGKRALNARKNMRELISSCLKKNKVTPVRRASCRAFNGRQANVRSASCHCCSASKWSSCTTVTVSAGPISMKVDSDKDMLQFYKRSKVPDPRVLGQKVLETRTTSCRSVRGDAR